jgi:hypothetical protein
MSFPVPDMIWFGVGEFEQLDIVLSFLPDMDTTLSPALGNWICTVDGVPVAAESFTWNDEHSMDVQFDFYEPAYDAVILLGWSPISPTLRTGNNYVYSSWEPQSVPPGF